MSRRHPKRLVSGEHFAKLPVEILTSEACRKLPYYATRVLVAIAAQYRGNNNGDLALTWKIAREFGIACKQHLVKGLTLLIEHQLIVKTRQGGKKPLGPCLYALTWMGIDECRGKLEVPACPLPTNAWAKWTNGAGPAP